MEKLVQFSGSIGLTIVKSDVISHLNSEKNLNNSKEAPS